MQTTLICSVHREQAEVCTRERRKQSKATVVNKRVQAEWSWRRRVSGELQEAQDGCDAWFGDGKKIQEEKRKSSEEVRGRSEGGQDAGDGVRWMQMICCGDR